MRVFAALKEHLLSLGHLLIPRSCVVCGKMLVDGERLVCTPCRWNMPLTHTWNEPENPLWQKLHAMAGVYRAAALFYYQKKSGYDELIYRFKYKGYGSLSYAMGKWFGEELKRSGLYEDIDLILPIPLHAIRLIQRGYNQSELLARGIGNRLQVKVSTRILYRTVHNRSQTHHTSADRWENVAGIFGVRSPERLKNKHILLVDDVLTTGATVESCIEAIRSATGECRISVVTLATSSKDIFGTK